MRYSLEFNPEFFNDIVEAVDWYNEKQAGLGDRFFNNVKKQTAKLSKAAYRYAVKYDNVRCMPMVKFPYLIHYWIDEETKTIKIEAMFHTSRDPKIWNERME